VIASRSATMMNCSNSDGMSSRNPFTATFPVWCSTEVASSTSDASRSAAWYRALRRVGSHEGTKDPRGITATPKSRSSRRSIRWDSESTRATESIRSHAVCRVWFSGMSMVNSSCRISSGSGSPWWGVRLCALAQPPAEHLRALLDDDVSRQQTLVDGAFGLPP
jgi:hypothetical protein